MELYHIQTLLPPHRPSLIATGMFCSDVSAIEAARQYLRKGEGLEVWRAGTLVYRRCPDSDARAPRLVKAAAAIPKKAVTPARRTGPAFWHQLAR
jgi:hypothetical protein